jgi:DNA-binding transcriptional ArsR family regulator
LALIVKEARIPQPAVSKVLKALEEKGLVARERLGRVCGAEPPYFSKTATIGPA